MEPVVAAPWPAVLALLVVASTLVPALPASSGTRPLSHIFADNSLLEDDIIRSARDDAVDPATRVAEYLSLVERSLGRSMSGMASLSENLTQSVRPRRDLPTDGMMTLTKDPQGVFVLKELKPRFNIPAKFPDDVVLFPHNESNGVVWYAVTLEADRDNPETSLSNSLVLYRQTDNRFVEQTRKPTFGASSLAVQDIKGWTYIVATERAAELRAPPQQGSILYRLAKDGRNLVVVETLETLHPSDICFWEYLGEHFLAVTAEFTNASGVVSYAADTLVMKWFGEHLDIVDRLPTTGARAVTAFVIGTTQYLAVANHVDNSGDTNIQSVVYRYDVVTERFVVHHLLETHAAVDVSFFSMRRPGGEDHFLVVANLYYQGKDKVKNYETLNVIYKWSENHFAPFQSFRLTGARKFTSFEGPRGESLLLAASQYGLHAFQYDGWHFQQLDISSSSAYVGFGASISSLRTLVFNSSEGLVVVANKMNSGSEANVFSLSFEKFMGLEELHSGILSRCRSQLDRLRSAPAEGLLARLEKAPRWDSTVVVVDSVTFESASTIESLSVNPGNSTIDESLRSDLDALTVAIDSLNKELTEAEIKLNGALKKNRDNSVDRVVLNEASIQCPGREGCRFDSAHVDLLNGENVDALLRDTVRLDDHITTTTLHLTQVEVLGDLTSSRVLGETAPLVSRVGTKRLLGSLQVDELVVRTGINVDGTIDGLRIAPDVVLLRDGDQRLTGFTSMNSHWKVHKLVLNGRVNGMTIDVSKPELPPEVPPVAPPASITVRNVELGGLLGGVDVGELATRALRTSGRQVVTGDITFAQLRTSAARAGLLSGIRIEEVVRTDRNETIPGELVFTQPLTASQVLVYERMNNVGVAADLSMDLLLNAGLAGQQHVTGHKHVRALRVTENAKVHGRVPGLVMPKEEALVKVIHDDIVIEGDLTIGGTVKVVGSVTANDIEEPHSGASVLRVVERGIPLDEPLPPSVVVEDLEVTNVDVTFVNNIRTDTWIVDSPSVDVKITSPVTFEGGLIVTGKSHLQGNVNGVNLVDLSETTLKTTGDQVISGNKKFDKITTSKIWSNDTLLGSARWKDILAHRRGTAGTAPSSNLNHVDVVKIPGDLVVRGDLSAKRLTVDGLINKVNVTKLLDDSVFADQQTVVIDGPKTFTQTLEVNHLHVSSSADGTDLTPVLPSRPEDELIFVVPSVNITRSISVAKLEFYGTLDGVSTADWEEPWLEVDGDQILLGDQIFQGSVKSTSVLNVSIGVNGVDLASFANSVAMINGPAVRLGRVTFTDTVEAKAPVTADSISGLKIEQALRKDGGELQRLNGIPRRFQTVDGHMVLKGGLEVGGKFDMVGQLSGENFKHLCSFADPSPVTLNTPQHLTVMGDVEMDMEPGIRKEVNGYSIEKMISNTWLRTRPAEIQAEMTFGDVQFNAEVDVEERIDGVNVKSLSERYLSLTKDQTVSTELTIEGGIHAKRNVISNSPVKVAGLVNGQRLSELASKVLLDGPDQDVPASKTFSTVHTTSDLSLGGTINGLDLAKDVVLLPLTLEEIRTSLQHNRVTEAKSFLSAHVEYLGLEAGARVQGVDLVAWKQGAVRADKGVFTITGAKTLNHPNVAGELTVEGVINGVRVHADSLLLRHSDQVVPGIKMLSPAPLRGLGLRVSNLDVTGRVNGVDLGALLASQAYRTGDIEVQSYVVFESALRGHSVYLDGLYQGINVSELIYEAYHPLPLNQYQANHQALLFRADRVKRSLESQGYYLNHYHASVQLDSGVRAVLPMSRAASLNESVDHAAAIAVIKELSPNGEVVANFFLFDATTGTIVSHPTLRMVGLGHNVRIVEPALFTDLNAVYWEAHDRLSGLYIGYVLGLTRDGRLGVAEMFRDAGASAWVSVRSWTGGSTCLIRGSPGRFDVEDGFCALHCLPGPTNHALMVSRPMHATTLLVDGSQLLFVASGASKTSEGSVSVWRYGGANVMPVLLQTLQVVNASSLAAIQYRGVHYLAAASGHIEGAPHGGLVHISRYNPQFGNWSHWMSVEVEGPRSLQFSVLPSRELVLYVSTTCDTDSLVVLQYRGLSGFVRRASAPAPAGGPMSAFNTLLHQHVVAVASAPPAGRALLLQANFKGSWEASLWARNDGH